MCSSFQSLWSEKEVWRRGGAPSSGLHPPPYSHAPSAQCPAPASPLHPPSTPQTRLHSFPKNMLRPVWGPALPVACDVPCLGLHATLSGTVSDSGISLNVMSSVTVSVALLTTGCLGRRTQDHTHKAELHFARPSELTPPFRKCVFVSVCPLRVGLTL